MEGTPSPDARRQWGMLKGVLKFGKNAKRLQKIERSSSTRQINEDYIKEAAEPSKGDNESETIVQIPISEEIGDTEGERKRESGSPESAQRHWAVLTNVLKFQRNLKHLHSLRPKPELIEEDPQSLQKIWDSIQEAGESSKGHNETVAEMYLSEDNLNARSGVHTDGLESVGERGMDSGNSNGTQPNWQLCSLISTIILKCIPFDFSKKKVEINDGYESLPDGHDERV